mmetsp:Transcript_21642/g.28386  ORF Transcript_21642/g.28386 Transcript_21642/m.28386 type:complete len:206 (-) Transcript_21642:148-765(-)
MIRTASALAFAGMASAFVPSQMPSAVRSTHLKMAVDDAEKSVALPFADKPLGLNGELVGDVGFDPFGFAGKGDVFKYREAELKHGRVCMLAMTGILVQEVYQLNENFPSTNFLEALKTAPALGVFQIVLAIAAIELRTSSYEGRVPGDIGFDPLRLSKDGINEKWALMELKHGRLAMIGFLGCLVQQSLTETPILEQTYTWARSL